LEFEKNMETAAQYLTFTPRFIDPSLPSGLWFCDSVGEVSAIQINAVCLSIGCNWDDVVKCRPFLDAFPYICIVAANSIARERMVQELRPRLPSSCIYVIQDSGFRNCKTVSEFVETYGTGEVPAILSGAEELPAYGLLNLASVQRRDMSRVPRVLSRFPRLDASIGGYFAGELSVWTGKRGIGKSTLLSQMLLEAIDQGHVVCAYSGELSADQFREWNYLQAAGPAHVVYETDRLTGKKLARADAMADKLISEWIDQRFWLFDLERNTRHDPETILSQFEYARMRYRADTFLVDNIMTVDFRGSRERDFNRVQSDFVYQLSRFAKRNSVHVHMVAHPRKSTNDDKATSDDVSGSGDITNRADNVFFLTTHSSTDEKDHFTTKPILKILKNRDFGCRGSLWLDFDKRSRRFFQDKSGDPSRRYSWDPEARQITLLEYGGELDEVFPPDEADNDAE